MAKTFENVKMPADIRQKMMAAVSMLLVSSIMVVSSTYAWFTLSTAPEVKNISTTVAGNGSLELALMPTDGTLGQISSAAVGSTATTVSKNTHWGNLVDLSDASYGLSSITLNPAKLDVKADDKTQFTAAAKPLAVAEYGYDGRIAKLNADNILVKALDEATSQFGSSNYGVRAIGEKDANVETQIGTNATYGYVIDLAVRLNTQNVNGGTPTDGKLLLQTAEKQRVYDGGSNAETMGGGSYMALPTGATDQLVSAIRVTFVQNYGLSGGTPKILGTAKLAANGTAADDGTTKYALELYDTSDAKVTGDNPVLLDAMEKNTAKQISAIVWLDGSMVKNADVATALTGGKLNLQFTTDVELHPAVDGALKGVEDTTTTTTTPDAGNDQTT